MAATPAEAGSPDHKIAGSRAAAAAIIKNFICIMEFII